MGTLNVIVEQKRCKCARASESGGKQGWQSREGVKADWEKQRRPQPGMGVGESQTSLLRSTPPHPQPLTSTSWDTPPQLGGGDGQWDFCARSPMGAGWGTDNGLLSLGARGGTGWATLRPRLA